MKTSKARFIPLAVIVSFLMSLFFIVPLFAVTGTVAYKDVSDATKTVTWARQGGTVTLEIVDSDLDLPFQRVLLPQDLASSTPGAHFATGTTTKGAYTISAVQHNDGNKRPEDLLAAGDTIVVGNATGTVIETVKKIVTLATTTDVAGNIYRTITVSTAFQNNFATATQISKVSASVTAGLFATCPRCARAQLATITAGDGDKFIVLNSIPVLDSQTGGADFSARFSGTGKDSVINISDLKLVTNAGVAHASSTGITAFDGNSGLITFTQDSLNDAVDYYVTYWGAGINDSGTTVKVTSQASVAGLTIRLEETGASTGIFRADVGFSSEDNRGHSTTTARLKTGVDDVVTLKYTDASQTANPSVTITVESTAPSYSNLSPAHNNSGQASRPEVQADVTDTQSGIVTTVVKVIFALDTDLDGDIETAQEVDVTTDGDLITITNGKTAKQRLPSALTPSTDATMWWWVRTNDLAGNSSISDRLPTAGATPTAFPCVPADFPTAAALVGLNPTAATSSAVGFCAPFAVKIDTTAPSLASATAGQFWDTAKTTTDKTNTDSKVGSKTAVRAVFNENLDCTTVANTDFEVDDVIPTAAECYAGALTSVFLTVPTMAPDARPKVELIGSVTDTAGNPRTSGAIAAATDGIAPGLTVTPSDRPVTKAAVTIKVVADEDVSTPVVQVRRVGGGGSAYENSGNTLSTSTISAITMVLKSARTYEGSFTAAADGIYSIYASATDATAANLGDKGLDAIAANDQDTAKNGVQIKLASAILFEKDTSVETPSITPATTDNANTFITIDFTNESKEYGLDTNGVLTAVPASVVTNYDSKGTTEITSITLDGVDIKADISTVNNMKFLYKASSLTAAAHTIKVKGKDLAGNETEFTGTVTVTARKAFALALNPGSNLVSIPGAPTDGAINTVIASTHPATSVRSYDPSTPGKWLTAVRGADGLFTGTLTTISENRGYWITTTNYEAINVDIPVLASGTSATPPTVAVSKGWNLLPVLDVTGALAGGATIEASKYFAGLSLTRVYSFDTVGNVWVEINTAASGDNVAVGSAYWVYATAAGTLVPGAE